MIGTELPWCCCMLQHPTTMNIRLPAHHANAMHALAPMQVKLNRGLDFVQLDSLLMDLKVAPDALEVPVPRYFVEDRSTVSKPRC